MSTITRMQLLGDAFEGGAGGGAVTSATYTSDFPTWKAKHTELNEEKERIREPYLLSIRALKKATLELERARAGAGDLEDLQRRLTSAQHIKDAQQAKWDGILARIRNLY
jgi:hypothetical protein